MTKLLFSIAISSFIFQVEAATLAPSIQVHGHRGARGKRPENTLPAFQFAIEKGVDFLELDLAVSKDSVLVISHDPEVNPEHCLRKNGQKIEEGLLINKLTWTELQDFDCGSLKNPKFPDQVTVPQTPFLKLDQLFSYVKQTSNSKIQFNIETKIYKDRPEVTPSPEEFSRLVVELIRKYELVDRCILQSFDERTLIAAKKLEPRLKTAFLLNSAKTDLVKFLKQNNINVLSPHYLMIKPNLVEGMHKVGIQVIPWTANDEPVWKKLIDSNVDAIISDVPDDLIVYLKKKGHRREVQTDTRNSQKDTGSL